MIDNKYIFYRFKSIINLIIINMNIYKIGYRYSTTLSIL